MTAGEIVIRDITAPAELRAVEVLQKNVWGLRDIDVVPLTQLAAAKAAGGVVIGAFDGDFLAGFAYGFAGYEEGRVTHHSHMLAVRPEYRRFSVGYRLKLEQRERVLEQGIDRMTWTFDPLQSLNAYLNFSKLGVVSDRYFVNFYGEDSASFLHRNGTDRLWVTWLLNSRRVRHRLDGKEPETGSEAAFAIVEAGKDNEPISRTFGSNPADNLIIEIPADIGGLERTNPGMTARWREATREAFTQAIVDRYLVRGFERSENVGRYRLGRVRSIDEIE